MTVIQANKSHRISRIFFTVAILWIIGALPLYRYYTHWSLFLLLALTLLILLYPSLKKTFYCIEIDDTKKQIRVKFRYLFNSLNEKSYDWDSTQYSYKMEAISRMSVGKTFRLFVSKKESLRIQVDADGWAEKLLDEIVSTLDKHGMQRCVYPGHSHLKDVFP